ncbi:MAG: hypothetical protein P1U67_10965 [Alcanivoracaceae bacterium]|nr:hypothetical protein [Alcanivoracaceae bacterium]
MHFLRAALLAVLFCSGSAYAEYQRHQWEGNLPERFFQTFLDLYEKDPGALARYPGGLQNISSEQLHRAIVGLDTTHFTYMYPMAIRGYEFSALRGTPIERLSVMAVRGDKLIPIPFQIDEFDRSGLIWIEGYNQAPAEGTPEVFDDFDEVVFMFRDGGQKNYDPALHGTIDGQVLREVRLDSPRNNPRFVYLVLDNPKRSSADYVSMDMEKGRLDSTIVEMEFDPKNVANIKHVAPKAGPKHHQNVVDNIYLNISTGILNEKLRVDLDTQSNIRAVPIAVKDGPVRVSMLVKARIWYAYLPTFFSQHFMINYYEQAFVVPSRFAIDSMRTLKFFVLFLREPRIEMAVDFHNLDGARVTFQSVYDDKDSFATVDGEMGDFEKRMNKTRLPGDWLYMDSNQGWDMFFSNHMPVVEGGLFDSFLEGMELYMLYQDDKEEVKSYERFPGVQPRIGFTSAGLPRTAIKLMGSIPKLNYSKMGSLGEAVVALSDPRVRKKFKDYDEVVSEVLEHMKERGRISTVEQLADAFIADLNRMRFTGMSRDDLNSLIRDAIIATSNDPGFIDHGATLEKMVELSKERGLDILQLRYATMDNTLWFPDWVGPGGPEDFHWQTVHPPGFSVRPWMAPAIHNEAP